MDDTFTPDNAPERNHTGVVNGCAHDKSTLGRTIKADGTAQVWNRCDNCGANTGGPGVFVPHNTVGNVLDALPIFDDYTGSRPPCVRCGAWGTQWHHFFPRHTARDNQLDNTEPDLWPGAWLCPDCHQRWHHLVEGPRRYGNPPTAIQYAPDDPCRPF